jgi:hypothetical protein
VVDDLDDASLVVEFPGGVQLGEVQRRVVCGERVD